MAGYTEYLRLDELLALQEPQTLEREAEVAFIIVHQVYELWFKLVIGYLTSAIEALDTDELPSALRRLRKVHDVERLLVEHMTLIDHLEAGAFAEFRPALGTASAAESKQFAAIEALSAPAHVHNRVTCPPTLWSVFCEHLRRAGFDMPSDHYADASARRIRTLARIYLDRRSLQADLCEALLAHDQAFCVWRHRHTLAAARQIGADPGTGGTSGVTYLERTLSRRFYPELWAARTSPDPAHGEARMSTRTAGVGQAGL